MEEEKTIEQTAQEAQVSVPEVNETEPAAEIVEAAEIVDEAAEAAPAPKPRRKRRTKAEIEADAKAAADLAVRGAKKAADTVAKATKQAVAEGTQAVEKLATPRTPAPEIFVQFYGDEVAAAALAEAAAAQFRAENKRAKVNEFKLYVKPEERAAYYVINGSFTGKVDF